MTPIYTNQPSPMESLKAFALAFGAGFLFAALTAALVAAERRDV